ncbi:MAG: ABC transporter permease [Candidatus Izemoplasmatales bacterium]|nr:ABC transporter permease [Candidatus Izemoplasmatales bacterium]
MKAKLHLLGEKTYAFLKGLGRTFFGNKMASTGTGILLFFILLGLFGPVIFPYSTSISVPDQLLPPSFRHPFGTDLWGRDVFRQIVAGTSDVLSIAFLAAIFSVSIALVLGMISGLVGGVFDKFILFLTNVFLTIPSLPVFLILAALFTVDNALTFAIILSIFSWAGLCRSIRSQIISLKERDFIQICKVMKMSRSHIIFKELFPNIGSYVLINFIIVMKNAITGSVGLMLLGVATFEPTNWGAILTSAKNNGALINPNSYMWLFAPILAIAIFQFGVIALSRGLDEVMNPRLRVM